jgi:hypothetical protein
MDKRTPTQRRLDRAASAAALRSWRQCRDLYESAELRAWAASFRRPAPAPESAQPGA